MARWPAAARPNLPAALLCSWRIERLPFSSEHAMTNQPKEQKRGVGRKDEDKRADDIPNSDTGSPAPDSAAPILQSEDDGLFDEDSPE
jgi:hypothetical protein